MAMLNKQRVPLLAIIYLNIPRHTIEVLQIWGSKQSPSLGGLNLAASFRLNFTRFYHVLPCSTIFYHVLPCSTMFYLQKCHVGGLLISCKQQLLVGYLVSLSDGNKWPYPSAEHHLPNMSKLFSRCSMFFWGGCEWRMCAMWLQHGQFWIQCMCFSLVGKQTYVYI